MLNNQELHGVVGSDAYSDNGEKIGTVGQLFLDDETGQPEFLTVNTGFLGTNESFIPVANATVAGDRVTVPFSKDKVKDAPNVSASSGHLSSEEERTLYEYYGLTYSSYGDSAVGGQREAGTVGHDVSGPTTDDAMTRSEERLTVGTASQEAGRARLRKYVVTEQETHTVPVRKEKAVLEREPITERNVGAATSGPDISEEEHEVILREERPVVDKTVEPVERVRLGTQETTEEQRVTEQVRKERIETDGDLDDRT